MEEYNQTQINQYLGNPPLLDPQRKLAFLIHPRDLSDIRNNYPSCNNISDDKLREMTYHTDPRFLGWMDMNSKPYGAFVVSFFIPQDLTFDRRYIKTFRDRIKKTAIYARDQGIEYLSLAALSAAFSRYAEDLQDIDGIKSTTGHVITPWTLEKATERITKKYGLKNPNVSVIGAAGSTGILLSRRLNRAGYPLTLIDLPDKQNTLEIFSEKYGNAICTSDINKLNKSDIVLTVTNAPNQLIDIDKINSGIILIDDAQPWAWDHEKAYKRFSQKKDILPLEGGLLTFNDGRFRKYDINTTNTLESDLYCCLGEGIILAHANGVVPPIVGRNSLDNLEERLEISDLYGDYADNLGLTLATYQCGTNVYTNAELDSFSL